MTREEADAALARLEADLASDVALARTREQHLRASTRLTDLRRIRADLIPHAAGA